MFNKMSFNQIKSSIEKRRPYLLLQAPKPRVRLSSFKQINIDVVVNVTQWNFTYWCHIKLNKSAKMHFWPHESTCQNIAERSKRISSMWTNCIEDVTSKSKKLKLWIIGGRTINNYKRCPRYRCPKECVDNV